MPRHFSFKQAGSHLLRRAIAYLIDCVCVFLFFALSQTLILLPVRRVMGVTSEWFQSGLNTQLYTLATISVPVWLYFAWMESSTGNATIGKRLAGFRVIDYASHARIGFWRALLRTIIKLIPWEIAHLANNLPEPIWLMDEPGFRIGFVFTGLLMGVYILFVFFHPAGRAPHDLISGTMVSRTSVEKHRERDVSENGK